MRSVGENTFWTSGSRSRPTTRRSGSVLIYSVISMMALSAVTSLAVDWCRTELVKTELYACADAAARAGVARLQNNPGDGPAAAAYAASTIATMNAANGQGVQLDPVSDIELGSWSTSATPQFIANGSPCNAIRITARRDQSRGTAVPMAFASMFGINQVNVKAVATARTYPLSYYGIVGLDHVKFASLGVLAKVTGNIYSNGDISIGTPLGLLVGVQGDARSYQGNVSHGSLATISGSTTPLPSKLEVPPVTIPVSNDNSKIASLLDSNGSLTTLIGVSIPSGMYVVQDLNMLAGIAVNLQGPVEIFVKGKFNLAAGVNLLGSTNTTASNFKVRVAESGEVNFLANLLVPVAMDLYAPHSAIQINVGVNKFTGVIIAKSIDVNLPVLGEIVQDTTIKGPGPSIPSVSLVR